MNVYGDETTGPDILLYLDEIVNNNIERMNEYEESTRNQFKKASKNLNSLFYGWKKWSKKLYSAMYIGFDDKPIINLNCSKRYKIYQKQHQSPRNEQY